MGSQTESALAGCTAVAGVGDLGDRVERLREEYRSAPADHADEFAEALAALANRLQRLGELDAHLSVLDRLEAVYDDHPSAATRTAYAEGTLDYDLEPWTPALVPRHDGETYRDLCDRLEALYDASGATSVAVALAGAHVRLLERDGETPPSSPDDEPLERLERLYEATGDSRVAARLVDGRFGTLGDHEDTDAFLDSFIEETERHYETHADAPTASRLFFGLYYVWFRHHRADEPYDAQQVGDRLEGLYDRYRDADVAARGYAFYLYQRARLGIDDGDFEAVDRTLDRLGELAEQRPDVFLEARAAVLVPAIEARIEAGDEHGAAAYLDDLESLHGDHDTIASRQYLAVGLGTVAGRETERFTDAVERLETLADKYGTTSLQKALTRARADGVESVERPTVEQLSAPHSGDGDGAGLDRAAATERLEQLRAEYCDDTEDVVRFAANLVGAYGRDGESEAAAAIIDAATEQYEREPTAETGAQLARGLAYDSEWHAVRASGDADRERVRARLSQIEDLFADHRTEAIARWVAAATVSRLGTVAYSRLSCDVQIDRLRSLHEEFPTEPLKVEYARGLGVGLRLLGREEPDIGDGQLPSKEPTNYLDTLQRLYDERPTEALGEVLGDATVQALRLSADAGAADSIGHGTRVTRLERVYDHYPTARLAQQYLRANGVVACRAAARENILDVQRHVEEAIEFYGRVDHDIAETYADVLADIVVATSATSYDEQYEAYRELRGLDDTESIAAHRQRAEAALEDGFESEFVDLLAAYRTAGGLLAIAVLAVGLALWGGLPVSGTTLTESAGGGVLGFAGYALYKTAHQYSLLGSARDSLSSASLIPARIRANVYENALVALLCVAGLGLVDTQTSQSLLVNDTLWGPILASFESISLGRLFALGLTGALGLMTLVGLLNVALSYDDYRRADSLYERVDEYANLSHATVWAGVQVVVVSLTALGTGVVTV